MSSLVDYKGFDIVDPTPSGPGGVALNDNFKRAGDSLVGPEATFYVDLNRTDTYVEDGSFYRPYKLVQDAITAAVGAGKAEVMVSIAPGNYNEEVQVAIPTGNFRFSIRGAGTGTGNCTTVSNINFILPDFTGSTTFISLADINFDSGSDPGHPTAMTITDNTDAGFTMFYLTGVQCWARRTGQYALHVTDAGGTGTLQIRCDAHCSLKTTSSTSNAGDAVTGVRLERGDLVAMATTLSGLRAPAVIASGTSSVSLTNCHLEVAMGTAGAADVDCVQGSDTANLTLRDATLVPAGNGQVVSHTGTFNGTRGYVLAADAAGIVGAGTGGIYLPAGALLLGGQMLNESGSVLPVTVASPALRIYLPKDSNTAFTPATPGDWATAPPVNVSDALNRIAAEVVALKGGPIS